MKIVVLDAYTLNPGEFSWDGFARHGELEVYDRTTDESVVKRIRDASAIFTNKVVITAEIMAAAPQLKYIGVMATGVNVVDLGAAKKAGITVTNIPAYSTDSVAQLVFSFILNLTNQIAEHNRAVRDGAWTNCVDFSFRLGRQVELAGKVIGIVGFGRIGQKVATIAQAFGMKVLFQSRSVKENVPAGFQQVELDDLLRASDFVSLNCPLTADSFEFMNASKFSIMKKGAVLINTGRGPLVHEQDLANALNDGHLGAACLDVLSTEPPKETNPLLNATNCYITPHIAWATFEARTRLMEILLTNFEAYLNNKPQNIVT
ncbi:D-2-hydroxyacid dehydrogenase [Mangrovibacterium sp.]|uniref:D-2-hydroxyacid dehydrogenase n=1 Tax=Mangrovibacterium sp. TaxID=1961364 RepID=UPI0035677E27